MQQRPGNGLKLMVLLLFCLSSSVFGQDEEKKPATGRVVGKVWHTRVDFAESFKYMDEVRKELGLENNGMVMMMPGPVRMGPGAFSTRDADKVVELKGTLFFLETSPQFTLNNPISFELIGDLDAFETSVRGQHSAMGPLAEVIGSDDFYEVKLKLGQVTTQSTPEPAEGGDGRTEVRQTVTIAVSVGGSEGAPADFKPPESISFYYRYSDGIMFSSRSEALRTIELPTRESLKLSDEDAASDIFADFDFREIPRDLKTVFWNTVEASASTWLQRFDNEELGEYSLRRSIGEGRLGLMKAALFDVERIRFGMSLSAESSTPVVGNLRISVRPNSQLSETLKAISERGSRLQGIDTDDSPLVISSTLNMPEWTRVFAATFVESLRLKLRESAGGDEGAGLLIDDLMTPLSESAIAGNLDAAAAIRGNVANGLVVVGGLRLERSEDFLASLQSLLLARAGETGISVSSESIADHTVLTVRSEAAQIPGSESSTPVNLHLAGTGSWLWIAMGGDLHEGETARAAITELIQKSDSNSGRSGESIPFYVRFRLDRWLGDSEDGFSKAPQNALTSLEKWLSRATSPRISMVVNGEKVESGYDPSAFNSHAAKFLKPENSQLEVRVKAAPEEIVVDATVGTGIFRFLVAQQVESQSRMFSNLPFQFKVGGEGQGVKVQGTSISIGK